MQRTLWFLAWPIWLALTTGFSCAPPTALPPLVSTFPTQGQTIARTEWLRATFSGNVDRSAIHGIRVFCNGDERWRFAHRLRGNQLVAQPVDPLPESATCSMELGTVEGLQVIGFQTAGAGTSFSTVHDRRDPDQPLPFPDDAFLVPDATQVTNQRPDFTGRLPSPAGTAALLLNSLKNVAEATSDGWSPVGPISVQLSAAPDPATLPLDRNASLDPLSSVALLDMTPGSSTFGTRIPFSLIPRSDTLPGQPLVHALVLHPGIPLEPEGTYGLIITDRVLSQGGEPLGRSGFFDLAVAAPQAGEHSAFAETRVLADEVMHVAERVSPIPIPRFDVVVATRISIRSTDHFPNDLLAMRQDVLATPPNVVIASVVADFDPDVAAIVKGTFQVPSWDGPPGGLLNRDANGLPSPTGVANVPFILALPADAAINGFAPALMYQHGNPGSSEAEVPGAARSFHGANGFAVGGFTDPLNRGFPDAAAQQNAQFTNVLFYGQTQDFYVQTYAEQMAFVQTLQSMDTLDVLPVGAPDGVPDLDPSALVYEGISYGSTHATALLAYEPNLRAAALVAGAGKFIELLEYQDRTTPDGGPRFLTETLPANLTAVRAPDLWMALSLFAISYDRQEPHNHARFIYQEPVVVDGTSAKASILLVEGIGDSFTANNASRSLARQLGAIPQLGTPPVSVIDLPNQSGPIQANLDPSTTAAMVQYVPEGSSVPTSTGCAGEFEGHFCAQAAPEARAQRIRFYQSALVGTPVID